MRSRRTRAAPGWLVGQVDGAQVLEGLDRAAEVLAGIHSALAPPQPLPVGQLGAGGVDWTTGSVVVPQRLSEQGLGIALTGRQGAS